MKMDKQLAAMLLMLALASGCAEPTAPSDDALASVDTPPTNTTDTLPAVRERTVVTLTDAAVAKFNEFLATEPTKHIRLTVKHEGPTGFVYDLQIDDMINDADIIDRSHGFTLVVDRKSSIYLEGSIIDWQTQPNGQAGFKFENPNAVER